MILKRFIEKRHINTHIKESLELVKHKLEAIRKQSSILAICPQPTGYNWKGINLATKHLFPDQTFEIAQYFSASPYSLKEIQLIVSFIIDLRFSQVIFSGFPAYFEIIIEEITKKNKDIKIGIIFYGYLSEMTGEKKGRENFQKILTLIKNKKIHKIGLNKKGLPETIQALTGLNSHYIIVKNPNVDYSPHKYDYEGINIGVLGDNSFRKNLHNQVGASLLIPGANVHVIDKSEFDYFGVKDRIIEHGRISDHKKYLDLLSSMNINLYVSFSESWGLVTTDSLSMGIPCLVSSSGNIFDWDEELKELLVVKDYDNSYAISQHIKMLLSSKTPDSGKLKEYVRLLNSEADKLLSDFLDS